METTAEVVDVRRSRRTRRNPADAGVVPVSAQDAPQPAGAAGRTENTERNNKRKHSSIEPELRAVKHETVPTEQTHEPRYFCPISGCTYSKSTRRGLKVHYNTKHEDLTDKEEWDSRLAKEVPYDEWLVEKERLNATAIAKKGKKSRKNKSPLRKAAAARHVLQESHLTLAAGGTPDVIGAASAACEGEPAPRLKTVTVGAPVAIITLAVNREEASSPPPAKRRKLDDLLETHQGQLYNFIEQELKEANERTASAEAKLQQLTAQKGTEVPSDAEKRLQEIAVDRGAEIARTKLQTQKMQKKIRELEAEIQEEKAFGSSTRLRIAYLHQARVAAKLNPTRPEHGGFVY